MAKQKNNRHTKGVSELPEHTHMILKFVTCTFLQTKREKMQYNVILRSVRTTIGAVERH